MKRILIILLLLLTGCGGADTEPVYSPAEPETQPAAASTAEPAGEASAPDIKAGEPEGFPFEYEGETIYVGIDAAPVVRKLGEPLNYFEAPSCAFEGIDKTYFYSGIELHTFPLDGKDYILAVLFTDDSVETPEGVYLGMPLEAALDALGGGYTQDGGQYVYVNGGGSLSLFAEDGAVAELSYNYELEGY